ncbi:carboxypeptidase regulatory-like domain-containing protein [bacterium]|nr:carboxypeptidase regulatory-like domain-containing protein [bacterium]
MRIGTVSDERYVALADVSLEFEGPGGSTETRSRASGSVYADLVPGEYLVTLQKAGYGAKRVRLQIAPDMQPYDFRLLTDGLVGYAWPKWVRSGEQAEFRVHAVEQYHLELYRMGSMQELIKPLGWFDEHGPRATMQITPDGDYTRSGVKFNSQGYTNPHHKQYMTAPERSGLYYFHARTQSGRVFSFPWIVAPARPTARLAVLASNITWNAYNAFGGRSNYINPVKLPDVPIVNSRQELQRYTDPDNVNYDAWEYAPLSFDRPEPINHIELGEAPDDPIEGRASCHLASAEWRLLAWLERNGFSYDYWAETQLHFGTLNLADYDVLMISTHPEYWSKRMFDTLHEWVFEKGGKLIYLGGNGLNCEVDLTDESTMIVKNGDDREMKRRGLESRFHFTGVSEAALLGVAYDDRGIMTSAPFEVIEAGHWALEGTGLKTGESFGSESLHRRCPGGASGHETDKRTASTPPGTVVIARGLNPGDGGAQIVTFETPSGGAVFSAGSITWPSSILVSEPVSRITANVLNRFLKGR